MAVQPLDRSPESINGDHALGVITNWREYIHTDPSILVGKPVIKGTRLSVDFILRLFGNGWTSEQVLESYPQLTPAALQAIFAFAAEPLSEKTLCATPVELA